MSELLSVLAVLALIAGNAFFVIGECTVVTARRAALAPRAEAGSSGARAALRLMDDPVRVISTVQVGITAIGILLGPQRSRRSGDDRRGASRLVVRALLELSVSATFPVIGVLRAVERAGR